MKVQPKILKSMVANFRIQQEINSIERGLLLKDKLIGLTFAQV